MSLPRPAATTPERIADEALAWFVRRTGGSLDAGSEATFQVWLDANPSHREAYGRHRAEWAALGQLPAEGLDILRANLADDVAAASAPDLARRPGSPARRRLLVPAFSAAAIAVVAGGAGLMTWNHWQARPVFMRSFDTQRGQQRDVTLPDGSRLRLDTATRLEVTYYRHRREVRLPEGQAVFSVQGDAARPFQVIAGPVLVTVVGTRFSVRHTPALPGDNGVRVAVEEGRVRVERATPDVAGGPAAVFLSAGQQIASNARGVLAPVRALSTAGIAPWRDGRVSFDNARLDHVLAELERYGNTRLMVRDPEVANLRITGTFNPARLNNFARMLPQAAPVRLREAGGTTEIVRMP